ncbi:glycine receptor subunit alpha-4-like isoform X2 [Thrips palmi]|uniref:pH-sensitive chloride channel 2 n=1 Tax=Thrips palmi TaxID=161013 RepID=A0A6P9A1D5_THRPL|nr:glycine receptor subunit alpha-4-like isoform X2 [Thrips palmi]
MTSTALAILGAVCCVGMLRPADAVSAVASPSRAVANLDSSSNCPALEPDLSSFELLVRLTDPCRYDRFARPEHDGDPLPINTRMFVYYLGSVEAHTLRFSAHIMLRYRWTDPRLAFSETSPALTKVIGETMIRDRIWVPHVYLVNEHESRVMGAGKEDVIVTIKPSGTVLFSTRIKVTMLCIMDLQKFPFDQQSCPMVFESWMYNTTEMQLHWEKDNPVILDPGLRLTEYSLSSHWANESEATYQYTPDMTVDEMGLDKFGGNYSRLNVQFLLKREVGHYIMDYYVPSILLVVVSWVSFWLDPNAVPGRTTLGTSTMLTFITLTRNSGSPLPKVSYIKATEIWFMVCTAFIFGSLVEFAFVNTIWRRKNNVELKKVNTKYVLKSTLTPTLHRKQTMMERCRSCPDMVEEGRKPSDGNLFSQTNTLSVGSLESMRDPFSSTYTLNSTLAAGSVPGLSSDCHDIVVPIPAQCAAGKAGKGSKGYKANNMAQCEQGLSAPGHAAHGFTTMTPQEIAQWIDRRSRVVFPLSFVVFNVLYWGFVWI